MNAREFRDHALRSGALLTGGPVPADFARGWGHHPFQSGMKAHYWKATSAHAVEGVVYGLRSVCGLTAMVTECVPLLEPGNLPFCVKCENYMMKAGGKPA